MLDPVYEVRDFIAGLDHPEGVAAGRVAQQVSNKEE